MHTNRLAGERSPYLLQHAHNPVDWYPWGAEAFERARRENKPIFLSIGYSTCHWCHVMERESFEDEKLAELLNRHFVPVKVDREERPDIDRIYMTFVQATTGGGGWPMSVFLTPELKPFFGGTYFPPDDRYGRPGFGTLLDRIAQAWATEREQLERSGDEVTGQLQRQLESGRSGRMDSMLSESCFLQLRRSFDPRRGGFGGAPKFPRPVVHNFLLRYYARTGNREALDMVLTTLKGMARGGMNDQLGGGFHRYSVDERWFVPHFEKMLYDQAQLAVSFVEAFQITAEPFYADAARATLDYVLRDMRDPGGAFYSAEDADSASDPDRPTVKSEGAFYLWTAAEIDGVLGREAAARFGELYGVEENGNVRDDPHGEFRGRNILYAAREPGEVEPAGEWRSKLLEARSRRPRPHLDDKILTAWNALMISALARAGAVLDEARYSEAAERAADFILTRMYDRGTGVLLRRYRQGDAAIQGFLDDYAFLIEALLDLYQTGFDLARLETALELAHSMLALFEDKTHGGFYSTAEGDSSLILRVKEEYDGAEPSGNSAAVLDLLRLAGITGRQDFAHSAERAFAALSVRVAEAPTAAPQLLAAYEFASARRKQIILVGDRRDATLRQMLRALHARFLPHHVLLLVESEAARRRLSEYQPAIANMPAIQGRTTAYVCEDFTCRLPVSEPADFVKLLE
ncbi:MAG: thioredoxin domain-containing protein [Bryobacterales bacterium]|nr:thioredoxin domain-containing protein [Bryobacterales bacterium]